MRCQPVFSSPDTSVGRLEMRRITWETPRRAGPFANQCERTDHWVVSFEGDRPRMVTKNGSGYRNSKGRISLLQSIWPCSRLSGQVALGSTALVQIAVLVQTEWI